MPNAWDIGSAVLLASLGFEALATTSGGFAATRGRLDGSMTQSQVLEHVGEIVAATELPVSADLENCFAHDPEGVAETVNQAVDMGVAGCSVEDYSGRNDEPIYELAHAAERVAAAAEAAHGQGASVVLTARAENWPTPSPASRPISKRAPTCSSLPGWWTRTTCASSSVQWTFRSASWFFPVHRPSPNWRSSV